VSISPAFVCQAKIHQRKTFGENLSQIRVLKFAKCCSPFFQFVHLLILCAQKSLANMLMKLMPEKLNEKIDLIN